MPVQFFGGSGAVGGTSTWVCPPGVFDAIVYCAAAGGMGGGNPASIIGAGGGGSGGAIAVGSVSVTPGTTYNMTRALSATSSTLGVDGLNGGDSWFGSTTTVCASGGQGGKVGPNGAGGVCDTTTSVGNIAIYPGGSGSPGVSGVNSGAGGGGANYNAAGPNASGITPGAGGGAGITNSTSGNSANPTSNTARVSGYLRAGGGTGGGNATTVTTARRGGLDSGAGAVLVTFAIKNAFFF